eukprot:Sspe_Gene.104151::Locus_80070_Transcript_1_1_Confidence_1.000_Length_1111::g.104151::m.104151
MNDGGTSSPLSPPPASLEAQAPEVLDISGGTGGVSVFDLYKDRVVYALGAVVRLSEAVAGIIVEEDGDKVVAETAEGRRVQVVKGRETPILCGPVPGPIALLPEEVVEAKAVCDALRARDGYYRTASWLPTDSAVRAQEDAERLAADEGCFVGATGDVPRRDGKLRGDSIQWLSKRGGHPEALQLVIDRMQRLRRALAFILCKPLPKHSLQLARYPGSGVGYVMHRDVKLNSSQLARRRLTCIYYFNTPVDGMGGDLVLWPRSRLPHLVERRGDTPDTLAKKRAEKKEESVAIAPLLNTMAIFHSHISHAVLPEHTPRVALTCWMCGDEPLGLPHPDAAEEDIDSYDTSCTGIFPS